MSERPPTLPEPVRHRTITITESCWGYASRIGRGNHSRGIRLALVEHFERVGHLVPETAETEQLARRLDGVHK